MKPIRIFTPDTELLGEISNYESLFFVRSFHGIGDLELRINRYKNHTDTLRKGNVIVVGNDAHKAYEIAHREIEIDSDGKLTENWLIKALELKAVTSRRPTLPPDHTAQDNRSGSAETVMKHYVSRNVVNPVDPMRKVSEIVLAPDQLRGSHITWQSRLKSLGEDLTEISQLSGVGWNTRVDYDLRKWVFDVVIGRNRSVNQTENSPVIFSPQFGNIRNMHYVESDLDYYNVAYVAGQGEGVDRRIIVVGNATGLARRELYVDARDIAEETDDETPVPRPEADIIADLRRRGEQKLAEHAQESYLEAQIMTPVKTVDIRKETHFMTQFQINETVNVTKAFASSFVYEVDYDLGDIVTVQNKEWGVTLDARITEIKEIYEPGGFSLEATFGNSRPTLVSKIKQELSGMRTEITR